MEWDDEALAGLIQLSNSQSKRPKKEIIQVGCNAAFPDKNDTRL